MTQSVLVTGAGRGLGLAIVRECVRRGDQVIATVRNLAAASDLGALAALHTGQLSIVTLDVSSEASCAALTASVPAHTGTIDLVVHCAGINSRTPEVGGREAAFDLEALSQAALERILRTNAIGPLLVTRALLPLLEASAAARSLSAAGAKASASLPPPRVICVSSRRGSLSQKDIGGNYGYCMSKAALNMASRAMAFDLLPRGIVVVALHPGTILTQMAQPDAQTTPEDAARQLLDLAGTLERKDAGRFLTPTGRDHPW